MAIKKKGGGGSEDRPSKPKRPKRPGRANTLPETPRAKSVDFVKEPDAPAAATESAAKEPEAEEATAVKAPAPKPKASTRRPSGPSPADRFNGWAAVGTVVAWVCLLLGQRVLETQEGLATVLSVVGVAGLMLCFAQRLWAFLLAAEDRLRSARAFMVTSGIGLLSLALYFLTTDKGRELVRVAKPKLNEQDLFGEILTVSWIALLAISLLPAVLGEISRRSMIHAERIESRRIIAAVVAGTSLALAAIYGSLFVYTAEKLDVSADFSFFRVARPSESTRNMLEGLEEPMRALVFFPEHSEVGIKVQRYLEELKGMGGKIEVERHDRLLDPDLAKEHKVNKDGVVVLVRGSASEILDIGDDEQRAAPKLRKLDGEFQKSAIKALRDKRTAYFTVGHNELNEATDRKTNRTVNLLKQLIEQQNYGVKNLGIAEGLGSKIPDDATMVLILGPTEPFGEREIETLRSYLDGGGHVFMALDPDAKIDLAPLAAIVGVKWEQALVIHDQMLYRIDRTDADKKILVAKRFSSHASVSTLSKAAARGAAVLIPGAAPIDKLEEADKALSIDFPLKSTAGSYVDVENNWTFDKDKDKPQGTYNLAAAVSKKIEQDQKKDALEMRAFVLGDADAFTDPVMEFAQTNRILVLEAMRWLGGEESFSGEISSEEDVSIVHTKSEDQLWFYSTILVAPLLVGLSGFFAVRRSRRRQTKGGHLEERRDERMADQGDARPRVQPNELKKGQKKRARALRAESEARARREEDLSTEPAPASLPDPDIDPDATPREGTSKPEINGDDGAGDEADELALVEGADKSKDKSRREDDVADGERGTP
jgi:hypothetical protein